jgi:hypothetical protein
MKKNNQKKSPTKKGSARKILLFLLTITILFLLLMILYSNFNDMQHHKKISPKLLTQQEQPKEIWLTVLTHGAFGSVLGLINTMQVIQDNLAGTEYKKLITQMRKNPYFYKHQPILEKGLIKIQAQANPKSSQNPKYAIYPITKAYEKISSLICPQKEKNVFYTFGWSGLMSQKQRRKEAIRFYNALSDEVTKYQKEGITPKIRIIAHSHGGNLSLNLGAVKTCLNHINDEQAILKIAQTQDDKESLMQMIQNLKALPSREVAKNQKGQKHLDFLPEKKDLFVDEFIMFGTPIQPETKYLALHDCFKKVYNFYSDEDIIQKMDWVSTKRYYSDQRLSLANKLKNNQKIEKIVQVRIMVGRKVEPILSKENGNLDNIWTLTLKNEAPLKLSVWDTLVNKAKSLFHKTSQDPTHRELWFICWDQDDPFAHLPTVIFTPAILNAVKETSANNKDLDLNITFTGEELAFYVCKHNDTKIQKKLSIFQQKIEKIKSMIKKWQPDDLSFTKEFEIINNYRNNI